MSPSTVVYTVAVIDANTRNRDSRDVIYTSQHSENLSNKQQPDISAPLNCSSVMLGSDPCQSTPRARSPPHSFSAARLSPPTIVRALTSRCPTNPAQLSFMKGDKIIVVKEGGGGSYLKAEDQEEGKIGESILRGKHEKTGETGWFFCVDVRKL